MQSRACVLALLLAWLASAEPSVTVATLEKPLARTPLAGRGPAFLDRGATYGTDPRLVVAIAGAESSFGKRLCGAFNAWNWFWGGTCPDSPFDSFESGINTVSKFLKKSYILKGYDTIEQMGSKYCAEGCEHWVPNVKTFYTGMGGDVRILTYDHPGQGSSPTNVSSGKPGSTKKPPGKTYETPASRSDRPSLNQEDDDGTPWLMYILIAIGVLILITGVLIAVLLVRRGSGKSAPVPLPAPEPPPVLPAGVDVEIPADWKAESAGADRMRLVNKELAGAEMTLERRPSPAGTLNGAIAEELGSALSLKVTETFAGTKATYLSGAGSQPEFSHTAVYLLRDSGLYRFGLKRKLNGSHENQLLVTFQQLLDSVKFSDAQSMAKQ